MSAIKDWLNWTSSGHKIIRDSQEPEVSKGTKPTFDTFDTPLYGKGQIIRGPEATPETRPAPPEESRDNGDSAGIRRAKSIETPGACPYTLPEGVRLIHYEKKTRDVAVTVCSVVDDVPKFIQHALLELDARLHYPMPITAGDSVFEILSKLADCGLELHLERPLERIIENSPESDPSKPTKLAEAAELNPHLQITDEDLPL